MSFSLDFNRDKRYNVSIQYLFHNSQLMKPMFTLIVDDIITGENIGTFVEYSKAKLDELYESNIVYDARKAEERDLYNISV